MARYVVWVNGLSMLLGAGVEPSEEAVNAERKRHGLKPLDATDEVNAIEPINPSILYDWIKKYPEAAKSTTVKIPGSAPEKPEGE